MIRTEIAMVVPTGDVDAVRDALAELGTNAFGVAVGRPGSAGTPETTELTLSVAGDVRAEAQQALEPFTSVRCTVELRGVPE
ncbi:hypothetical protein [Streptomyces lavendofoliae]|uniref:hypothetical protein n=1 Tax=Streptomyces lavendofoliae TaxID=67314 RepID=UPI00300E7F98